MMQQYFKIKEENKDSILFFRLGDFYEMFTMMQSLHQRNLNLLLQEGIADRPSVLPCAEFRFTAVRVTLQDLLQRAIRLQFANRRKILQRQKVL